MKFPPFDTCLFFPMVLGFSEFQPSKERDFFDKQWKLEEWIAIVLLGFDTYSGRLAMDRGTTWASVRAPHWSRQICRSV